MRAAFLADMTPERHGLPIVKDDGLEALLMPLYHRLGGDPPFGL